ncbi:MAG: hypothetical protein EAZ37_08205 [Burkholderiales bacterium]|nr:MAG: hypothetical protein EAZ37_08205 [Burkholderiales bacterium]
MSHLAPAQKAKTKTVKAPLVKPELFGMTSEPMTINRPKPSPERMKYLMQKHFQKMKLPVGIKNTVELVRQGRVERAMGR